MGAHTPCARGSVLLFVCLRFVAILCVRRGGGGAGVGKNLYYNIDACVCAPARPRLRACLRFAYAYRITFLVHGLPLRNMAQPHPPADPPLFLFCAACERFCAKMRVTAQLPVRAGRQSLPSTLTLPQLPLPPSLHLSLPPTPSLSQTPFSHDSSLTFPSTPLPSLPNCSLTDRRAAG